jgi:hypothetical protein
MTYEMALFQSPLNDNNKDWISTPADDSDSIVETTKFHARLGQRLA